MEKQCPPTKDFRDDQETNGRVYFVLMHETVYPEVSGTHHFLENSADHHCIIILHHQDTVVIQT